MKIHEIVKNFNKPFENDIDLEIGLSEINEFGFQSFTIKASRKRLRRLKEIAAYNVQQCLSSYCDIEHLKLAQILDV